MASNTALLIIDAQVNMFADPWPVSQPEAMLETILGLYTKAVAAGIPVIFVRHDGGEGQVDAYGSDGWQIHPELAPRHGEPIIDKRVPDAFEGTNLLDTLNERGIRHVIICGMQTDWCINATARRAAALGFAVTIAADAHSTCDSDTQPAPDIIAEHNRAFEAFAVVKAASELDFGQQREG